MALFLSTFINKIDKKRRVSVPASFRTVLASQSFAGIVVYRSLKYLALEGCGIERLEKLSESFDQFNMFSDMQDDLSATVFADSQMLSFDSEGRISLPKEFMEFANITNHVAFVGCGKAFQIWSPEVFKTYQEQARTRLSENLPSIKLTSKQEQ
jgi:MraZ protein